MRNLRPVGRALGFAYPMILPAAEFRTRRPREAEAAYLFTRNISTHKSLHVRTGARTDEARALPGPTVADLDAGALNRFRSLARNSQRLPDTILEQPDQDLLEKLHLVEGHYLTRAAALMFHPEPQRFFTGAYLKIGYFETNVDLRQALGLRHEDHFRAKYLIPALQSGFVEMTIPDRPKSSRQQYRLTAKAEALRARLPEEKEV